MAKTATENKVTEAIENATTASEPEKVEQNTAEPENAAEATTDAQGEALNIDSIDEMVLPGDVDDPEEEAPQRWRITDDSCADWALKKIKAEKDELDRITALGEAEIQRIREKLDRAARRYDQNTAYLTSLLAEFFMTVERKRTKTGTETYQLLNGKLIMKPAAIKPEPDQEKLVEWLRQNGHEDLIKIEESARWGDLKKMLTFTGTIATIADTGEIVEGINVSEVPPAFSVKV